LFAIPFWRIARGKSDKDKNCMQKLFHPAK